MGTHSQSNPNAVSLGIYRPCLNVILTSSAPLQTTSRGCRWAPQHQATCLSMRLNPSLSLIATSKKRGASDTHESSHKNSAARMHCLRHLLAFDVVRHLRARREIPHQGNRGGLSAQTDAPEALVRLLHDLAANFSTWTIDPSRGRRSCNS